MHTELRRLWAAESGGMTGNALSYSDWLLERLVMETYRGRAGTLAHEIKAAEELKRQREEGLRDA